MAEATSQAAAREKMVHYLQSAHALEEQVQSLLGDMISTTEDAEIRQQLEHHRTETERHAELLRGRLEELDADTSAMKDMMLRAMGAMKGLTAETRQDKAGKNARDAFTTEHLEIAWYEMLERVAKRAGDEPTADVARTIRADEEAMAQKIVANWDKFTDLALAETTAG